MKEPSPYKILGVSEDASWEDITVAYREKAQLHHPDVVGAIAPRFRALAEERMKEINAAYSQMKHQFVARRREELQDDAHPTTSQSAATYFERAHTYLDQQRYEEALPLFRQALQLQPEFAAAYLGMALTYHALRRHTEEIEALQHALALQPDLAWAHAFLGAAYLQRGETAAAAREHALLLVLDPALASQLWQKIEAFQAPPLLAPVTVPAQAGRRSPVWSSMLLGLALVAVGIILQSARQRPSEAKTARVQETVSVFSPADIPLSTLETLAQQYLLDMISYAGTDGGVSQAQLIEAAKRRLENLPLQYPVDAQKQEQARAQKAKGVDALRDGRVGEAIQTFREAHRLVVDDAEVLDHLGQAYLRSGELAQAQRVLFRTLVLAPGREATWIKLAQTYARQGNRYAAVACFANAYRFSHDPDEMYRFLQELTEKNEAVEVRTAATQTLALPLLRNSARQSTR